MHFSMKAIPKNPSAALIFSHLTEYKNKHENPFPFRYARFWLKFRHRISRVNTYWKYFRLQILFSIQFYSSKFAREWVFCNLQSMNEWRGNAAMISYSNFVLELGRQISVNIESCCQHTVIAYRLLTSKLEGTGQQYSQSLTAAQSRAMIGRWLFHTFTPRYFRYNLTFSSSLYTEGFSLKLGRTQNDIIHFACLRPFSK